MSTLGILKSLRGFGERLNPGAYEKVTGYFTLELSGPVPLLSHHKGTLWVPSNMKHSNQVLPWYGGDVANYALGFDPVRGEAFYAKLGEDLVRAGYTEPCEAVAGVPEYLRKNLKIVKESKGKCTIEGLNVDDSALKKTREGSVFAINRTDLIVITWKGVPIIDHPEFRRIFEEEFKVAYTDTDVGATHTDLVTGRLCIPIKVHHQVLGMPGTGGWAPLFSAKYSAYSCYRPYRMKDGTTVFVAQAKGNTLPVSPNTSRLYAHGANESAKAILPTKARNTGFLFWPETGTEHPIIPFLVKFLTETLKTEEATEFWGALEACTEAPDTLINILLAHGTQGRVCVHNWAQMRAGALRENLLGLHTSFKDVISNFTFPRLRLFSDPASDFSVIDASIGSTAWSAITGTEYQPQLLTQLSEVVTQQPMGGSQNERATLLNRNIAVMITWLQHMGKGRKMDPNKGMHADQDKTYYFEPELHPGEFFDVEPSNAIEAFGAAVGLASYLSVLYHGDRTKRTNEVEYAFASPRAWLGDSAGRFAAYEHRFVGKNRAKARYVWGLFMKMAGQSKSPSLRHSLTGSRSYEAATAYYNASRWVEAFCHTPLSLAGIKRMLHHAETKGYEFHSHKVSKLLEFLESEYEVSKLLASVGGGAPPEGVEKNSHAHLVYVVDQMSKGADPSPSTDPAQDGEGDPSVTTPSQDDTDKAAE